MIALLQDQVKERVEERLVNSQIALAELKNFVSQSKQVDLQVRLDAFLEEHFGDDLAEDAHKQWRRR